MKKIILLTSAFVFFSVAIFGQNADSIKQVVDTAKQIIKPNKITERPGVKKETQKPATQKAIEEQKPKAGDNKTGELNEKNLEQQKPATQKSAEEMNDKEEKNDTKGEEMKEEEDKKDEDLENEDDREEEAMQATETSTTTKENETILKVKIYDRNSMETVDGVEVYLFEMPDGKFVDTNLSFNGIASFKIDKDTEYEIRTCTQGYIKRAVGIFDCNSADKMFCLRGVFHFDYGPPETEENTLLAKIKMDPIAVGQTMELDNVYYDTGKSTLRPESKQELNRLYNLMKQYSTLKVEVSSHTDSRGSAEKNMALSTNRAKSCYNYLTRKGIGKDRVIFKGYGETRLINQCADGVKCSDVEHQKNRRTEISILEIEPEPCEPKL